jgi:magnesium chelatase family protein
VARRTFGLTADAAEALGKAVERYSLSGRGFDRALRVARTIADLEASERVEREHVTEALSFKTVQTGQPGGSLPSSEHHSQGVVNVG